MWMVWSREMVRGVSALTGLHQRPDAGEYGQDVIAARFFGEIQRCGGQDELDLVIERRAARAAHR